VLVALGFTCAFGLVVRLWGIGYLVPVQSLGDSSMLVNEVDVLRNGRPRDYSDPYMLYYPRLLAYAVSLTPAPRAVEPAASLDDHLRAASAPWRDVRLTSVILSMLAIPGAWCLARRFMDDRWAVLAAALCATSLLHVDFSAQEVPHGTVSSFVVLTLIAAIHLRRRADVAAYWMTGACAALAVGSLQNGIAVLPAVATAILLREPSTRRASPAWSLAIVGMIVASVLAFYPFLFASHEGGVTLAESEGERVLSLSGHRIFLEEFNGRGFVNMLHTLWCFDPILLVAFVLSAGLAAVAWARGRWLLDRGRARDLLVVLAFALPYMLAIGVYARSWNRFVLPLLPLLACAAAWGIGRGCELVSARLGVVRAASWIAACIAIVAAIPPTQLARVRAAPSTATLVADWFRANVSPHERIVCLPYVALPLLEDDAGLSANARLTRAMPWIRYQETHDANRRQQQGYEILIAPTSAAAGFSLLERDPMAYFAAYRARYVVLGMASDELPTHVERARSALSSRAPPVLRVTPLRVDEGTVTSVSIRHPDPSPDRPIFERPYVFGLCDAARMGRTFEVYRID
jgi:hypothetical protein